MSQLAEETTTSVSTTTVSISKPRKRGRKPRGGMVTSRSKKVSTEIRIPNIIIQLNCRMTDIISADDIDSTVYSPNIADIIGYLNTTLQYQELEPDETTTAETTTAETTNINNTTTTTQSSDDSIMQIQPIAPPEYTRTAAPTTYGRKMCFFCGCDDRPTPVAIPKSNTESYGQFCRPECAAAFVMNESIDTTTKYDRFQMLCTEYGNDDEPIKQSPSPHYLLEHYCGEMTPVEYHEMIGECTVVESGTTIRIFPRVIRESKKTSNPKTVGGGKYQIRRAESFFQM